MVREIGITTEYIKLDQFLKLAGVAPDGVSAKLLVQGGGVLVDGVEELRRGRKLYPGAKINFSETEYLVVAK